MAVKTAKNGVIVLEHNDTVAAGTNAYKVEAITICDPAASGSPFSVYANDNADASALIVSGNTTATPINIYVGGCISTGGGMLYTDSDVGTTCHIYVK